MLLPSHPPLPSRDALQAPMAQALRLAEMAVGLSEPNPRVGCVIVSADGSQWLGQGHTQAAGSPHAEVMALRDAAARGHSVVGASAHVTLEPCSHHGRTPPCCDALIAAGIGKVVVAAGDPNPLVNGQGMARLAAAGIALEWAPPAFAAASEALNIGFFHRMRHQRPWVRLKMAASLDGRSALNNGVSQWITGPEARADGHAWRRRAGAAMTGIGTVLADDPQLDVRAVPTMLQPQRVVIDARLETPASARLLTSGAAPLFYAASPAPERLASFAERGLEVVCCPMAPMAPTACAPGASHSGRVDLHQVVADLGQRQVNELHVEAGPRLSGALLEAGLVDECLVYLAPMLLGEGKSMASLAPLTTLAEALRFQLTDHAQVGADLRLRLTRPASPQG